MLWAFLILSLVFFVVGFTAFPISMYMESKTGRYDFYSVFGFGISLLSLMGGFVFAITAVAMKIFQRGAAKSENLSIK